MPYIDQALREAIEPELVQLLDKLTEASPGEMNYVLSTIIRARYPGASYSTINTAVGVLGCVLQEYYRTVVVPYEDVKLAQNGPIVRTHPTPDDTRR